MALWFECKDWRIEATILLLVGYGSAGWVVPQVACTGCKDAVRRDLAARQATARRLKGYQTFRVVCSKGSYICVSARSQLRLTVDCGYSIPYSFPFACVLTDLASSHPVPE